MPAGLILGVCEEATHSGAPSQEEFGNVCYLRGPWEGGAFQRVQAPSGQPLQPEATGAVMEVTKWLKPSV
jgi:hypothetical protein